MTDHRIRVERRGPQRFVAVCSCGWVGLNRKGTEFWNKAGTLTSVFAHQGEHEIPLAIPEYVDMDPRSRRSKSRPR